MNSTYEIFKENSDMIWILDLDRGKSVTNDAERVCEKIVKLHGPKRIIYRDTMGSWDELVHDNGKFTGFKAGREHAPK